MRVRLETDRDPGGEMIYWSLTIGQEYEVIGIEADSYRIVNDTGDPCLYDPACFRIVDAKEPDFWVKSIGDDGERYAYPAGWNRPGFFEDFHDRVEKVRRQFWEDHWRLYGEPRPPTKRTWQGVDPCCKDVIEVGKEYIHHSMGNRLMNDYYEKTLKSARTFLKRWNGANAEMLELTRSHKSLRIVVRRNYEGENLLIACIDPPTIKGPVRWQDCQIEITTMNLANETVFLVEDKRAGLEVVSGAIEIAENVKL